MIERHSFESASSDAVYEALLDSETGATSCNCKGWTFKRPGKPRSCKHTKELAAGWHSATPADVQAQVSPTKREKRAAKLEEFAVRSKGKRMIVWDEAELDNGNGNGPEPPKVKPMLASAMKDNGSTLDAYENGEWVLEEKLDGHRMIVVCDDGVTAWSRPGADRPAAVRELPEKLRKALEQLPAGIYDGELHVPGGTSSDVGSLVKAEEQRLVLFDVIESLGIPAMERPYEQRRCLLELVVQHAPHNGMVTVPEQHEVSQEVVDAIWERGGEGAILKRKDSTYKSGNRSPAWVKVKKTSNVELEIVGFKEGKRGPQSIAILKDETGRKTTCGVPTNAMVAAVEKDPEAWIGRRVSCEYLGKTTSGQWRHLVWDHSAA